MSKDTNKRTTRARVQRQENDDDYKFLASVPRHLYDAMKAEAVREGRSTLGQLRRILQERYEEAAIAAPLPRPLSTNSNGAAKTL